jgi:hypothetical protein
MVADVPEREDPIVAVEATGPFCEGWTITAHITFRDDGIAEASRYTIDPIDAASKEPAATVWRKLSVGAMRREIASALPLIAWTIGVEGGAAYSPPRPGRGGHSRLLYAQKAEAFVQALERNPDAPYTELERVHPTIKKSKWHGWLKRAEQLGFLIDRPPATSGKAGGRLSDDAIRLLAGKEE